MQIITGFCRFIPTVQAEKQAIQRRQGGALFPLQKKQEIIDKKNEALKTGDQRELEKVLSQDNKPVDNSVNNDKYNGLYERPIKKKS